MLLIGLLAGCNNCPDFDDIEVRAGPHVGAEKVDYVERAVEAFRGWTNADGACTDEIRLVPNIQVGRQEAAGRYLLRSDTILLDHTASAYELYSVALHELCHGIIRERPWLQDSFGEHFSGGVQRDRLPRGLLPPGGDLREGV